MRVHPRPCASRSTIATVHECATWSALVSEYSRKSGSPRVRSRECASGSALTRLVRERTLETVHYRQWESERHYHGHLLMTCMCIMLLQSLCLVTTSDNWLKRLASGEHLRWPTWDPPRRGSRSEKAVAWSQPVSLSSHECIDFCPKIIFEVCLFINIQIFINNILTIKCLQ